MIHKVDNVLDSFKYIKECFLNLPIFVRILKKQCFLILKRIGRCKSNHFQNLSTEELKQLEDSIIMVGLNKNLLNEFGLCIDDLVLYGLKAYESRFAFFITFWRYLSVKALEKVYPFMNDYIILPETGLDLLKIIFSRDKIDQVEMYLNAFNNRDICKVKGNVYLVYDYIDDYLGRFDTDYIQGLVEWWDSFMDKHSFLRTKIFLQEGLFDTLNLPDKAKYKEGYSKITI